MLGKPEFDRHTDDVIVLLHWLHAGVIIAGVAVVAVLIGPWPAGRRHGRVDALRKAAEAGTLVRRAEARALAQLTGTSHTGSAHDHLGARTAARQTPLVLAAVGSLSGAAIHAAVGPEHFREGLRFGIFFVLLALVQAVQAVQLVLRPTRRLVAAVLIVNLGTVALWALTRTVGLPFGLAEVESVGLLDVLSTSAEVFAIGCVAFWLRRAPRAAPAGAPQLSALRRQAA